MTNNASQFGNRLDVVLKIAERCNLACPYCYYFFQEHNPKAQRALIDEKTIRDVTEFLKEGTKQYNLKTLIIGLHGGEPLLMPKKRFDRYMEILNELNEVIDVQISMQTNGTLIDEEWIDLFEKHKIGVGVSIDGPEAIHDAGRPDHKGRGSYKNAVHGLRMLQKAVKDKRISPTGILCVANPDHDPEEIIRHVVEDLEVTYFNILLPREGYNSDIVHNQDRWIAYFDKVLKVWQSLLKTKVGGHRRLAVINEVTGVMNALIDERSAEHHDWMSSNRHFIMTISSEGRIGPDDNVMALNERFCESGMNVQDHSMVQFFESEFWKEFNDAVAFVPERCGSCEWYRTCRSGHLFNRYSDDNGFKNPSVFCETIDYLHNELVKAAVQKGISIEEIAKTLSEPPRHLSKDFMKPQASLV